jgi:hypothetical protein
MTIITETLINAYRRGHVTEDEYQLLLGQNPNEDQIVTVDYDAHKYKTYAGDVHILKRDPNSVITLDFEFNGGGQEIADNVTCYRRCPVSGVITKASIMANTTGAIVIDVWKKATWPPSNSESITASAVPTISNDTSVEDTTLTGWTVQVTSGDYFIASVDSCTTIAQAVLSLEIIPATQYVRIV